MFTLVRKRENVRDGGTRAGRTRSRPALECLERRELLTGTQPYLLTGVRWSNDTPITYSIAADGVNWDRKVNVLNAAMDARFASGAWQDEIARALQTWASVANINFVRVADSALAFDTVGKAQGDARFGDIRFGGYDFDNASELAHAYTPPPNGSTAAGDVAVNTAAAFNIGSQYDLYSVLLHEAGHSLGLDHPDRSDAVMFASYNGVRPGLDAGDIAGIRAIYGARIDDVYGQQGRGSGLSDAVDVSAGRVTPTQFALGSLSLTASGDSDYFSVVAPTSGASLHVMAIAGGVSMLSAQVSVYDASGALLDLKGDASAYGLNVTASVAGVVAGQRYYIKVSGATDDVFSIGTYDLNVSLKGEPAIGTTGRLPLLTRVPAPIPAPPSVTPPLSPSAPPSVTPPLSPSAPPSVTPPLSPSAPPSAVWTPNPARPTRQPAWRKQMPRFPVARRRRPAEDVGGQARASGKGRLGRDDRVAQGGRSLAASAVLARARRLKHDGTRLASPLPG